MTDKESDDIQLIGIYAVEPIDGTNKIHIKHIQNVTSDTTIRDTPIKQFNLTKDIHAGICACNITHFYLEKSKNLPVMHTTICANKHLRTIPLYRLFLSFKITDDIKTRADLLDKPIEGTYTLNVVVGSNGMTLDEDLGVFENKNAILDKMESFVKTEGMMMLTNELVREAGDKITEQYKSDFKFNIPDKYLEK